MTNRSRLKSFQDDPELVNALSLCFQAKESGRPEDKLNALEVANAVSCPDGDGGLGAMVMRTLMASFRDYPPSYLSYVLDKPDCVKGSTQTGWASPLRTRTHEAVINALGQAGVTIHRPETYDEYFEVAGLLAGESNGRVRTALLGQSMDATLIVQDYRVPGTLYHAFAVETLGIDETNIRRIMNESNMDNVAPAFYQLYSLDK